MAMKAAVAAFRDPGGFPGYAVETERYAYYGLLWSYYKNTNFDSLSDWQHYRENFQLYRNIRSIYNPTRRLVNFYVSHVYPGVLSEDASQLPDGVQLAIPLSKDTDDKLKVAIAQFWQWSNWQSENKKMVKFGGATGSCLVEIIDNVERGKVTAEVRGPWVVPDLELDGVGNLKGYVVEYNALDDDGNTYRYRKEVDQENFKFFKDDVPFDYGQGTEFDSPYGFVPAVWCKHIDDGDDYGGPAIIGSIGKIDELNGLVSHTHDQIDILIASPGIIASSGAVGTLGADSANIRTAASDEFNAVGADKQKASKRLILKGPADTSWVSMAGNLQPDQVLPHVQELIREIEHDFPELGMYQKLREMSEVSGPGAARLMGDVGSRVLEVASNYDQQSIKLFQMATAIGGMRLREGKEGWAQKTDQRMKFAPFDLDSYARGDLNMSIMPRPLIPMTEDDTITLTGKRLENAAKAQGIFSDDKVLEVAGITDEDERAEILAEREKESLAAPAAARGVALNAPPAIRGLLQASSNGKALPR